MKEIYKDVAGYEGSYQISNLGNVRSLDRKDSRGELLKGKAMKTAINNNGYKKLNLSRNGKYKTCYVHQLIAIAFLNHTPNGYKGLKIDHIDNNPSNSRLDNLQLISHRENISKSMKGGSSEHTGVCWYKPSSKWVARIGINGKTKHLGYFIDEIEASKAYNKVLNNLKTNKL